MVEVQSPFLLQLVRVVPLISNPFSQVKVHFEPILRKSFQIFWKNEILVIFKFSRSVVLQSDERSSPFRTREHKRLCNSRVVFAPYEKYKNFPVASIFFPCTIDKSIPRRRQQITVAFRAHCFEEGICSAKH